MRPTIGASIAAGAKLAGLLLLGSAIGLALGEGVARLLWQAPWTERLLAEQRRHQSEHYRLNSLELRDEELTPKPPGHRRVLVLGDSFTFGLGVEDEAAVFPAILERRLGALEGLDGGVEVLNGGLPGSLTADWVKLWDVVAPRFEPDLVLLVFFLRDGTEISSIPDFFGRIRREIVVRNRRSQLYRHSYLYRLWRDQRDRARVARLYTERFRAAYFGDDAETAEWRRARTHLLRIRDAARARGAEVALVVFPILVELDARYPFREICELVEAFGRASDMPVHSLLPAFLGRSAPDLWVSALDQHPNAEGHAIAAESLLPFVAGLLAKEPGGAP